jgi:hypothetical protein
LPGLITQPKKFFCPFLGWYDHVIHKGIQYIVAATAEPGVWRWQFQIGNSVRTGKTQTSWPRWPRAAFS